MYHGQEERSKERLVNYISFLWRYLKVMFPYLYRPAGVCVKALKLYVDRDVQWAGLKVVLSHHILGLHYQVS